MAALPIVPNLNPPANRKASLRCVASWVLHHWMAGPIRHLPDEPVHVFFHVRRWAFQLGHKSSRDAINTLQACVEKSRPRVLQFQRATLSTALCKALCQA